MNLADSPEPHTVPSDIITIYLGYSSGADLITDSYIGNLSIVKEGINTRRQLNFTSNVKEVRIFHRSNCFGCEMIGRLSYGEVIIPCY